MKGAGRRIVGAVAVAVAVAALTSCSADREADREPGVRTSAQATVRPGAAQSSPTARPAQLRSKVGKAPAPKPLAGHAYGAPSAAALRAAAAVGAQYEQFSTGRVVRGVEADRKQVLDVVVVGLKAKYADNALFRSQITNSVVTGLAGSEPKLADERIGRRRVRVGTGGSAAVMGWFDGSHSVVAVVSYQRDVARVRNVAKLYPGHGKSTVSAGRSLGNPKVPAGGE